MKANQRLVGLRLIERPHEIEASLWRRLRFEDEPSCREQLFERYQGLAKSIALGELQRRPPYGLERGDFLQLAYGGLLEAIDRFDPLDGAPFSAYARRRIRGAISDGVAKSSETSAQYNYARRVETERVRSLGPSDPGAGRDPLAQLSDMAVALALGFMIQASQRTQAHNEKDGKELADLHAYESVAWRDMELSLLQEVERLPDAEQTVLKQHYLNEMSFTDIAALLQLSKGRISQLHRSALERLRDRITSQL